VKLQGFLRKFLGDFYVFFAGFLTEIILVLFFYSKLKKVVKIPITEILLARSMRINDVKSS
jgi:hypothetical protein